MASHQGRFQEPTEMAVFEGLEKPAEKKEAPLMGGDSQQMDLFSANDFSESGF